MKTIVIDSSPHSVSFGGVTRCLTINGSENAKKRAKLLISAFKKQKFEFLEHFRSPEVYYHWRALILIFLSDHFEESFDFLRPRFLEIWPNYP